jgi:hypothetical protein
MLAGESAFSRQWRPPNVLSGAGLTLAEIAELQEKGVVW